MSRTAVPMESAPFRTRFYVAGSSWVDAACIIGTIILQRNPDNRNKLLGTTSSNPVNHLESRIRFYIDITVEQAL